MCSNVSLVLFIGLPGSGKTTLCKHFKTVWNGKPIKEKIVHIIHICFDDVIPLEEQEKFAVQQALRAGEDFSSSEDKSMDIRNADVHAVDEMCWKQARQKVLIQVEDLIKTLSGGKNYNNFKSDLPEITPSNDVHYVILIDDNFYYRSMRYEYYQLARKYTLVFGQVFVDCTVGVALKQNSQRSTQVPESVIISMNQRLEIPEPDKISWEANSFSVKSDPNANLDFLQDLLIAQPVEPIIDRTEEIRMAQLVCSKSLSHQADLILRSLVAQTIKDAKLKTTVPCQQMKTWAAGVNSARQTILTRLREGTLSPPAYLTQGDLIETREEFKNWLCIELQRAVPGL